MIDMYRVDIHIDCFVVLNLTYSRVLPIINYETVVPEDSYTEGTLSSNTVCCKSAGLEHSLTETVELKYSR